MNRQLRFLSRIVNLVLCSGFVVAQSVIVPANAFGVDNGNNYFWGGGGARQQVIFDSDQFTSQDAGQTITVTGLSWALSTGSSQQSRSLASVNVYVMTAGVDYASASTTFAANRSGPLPQTPNYSGPLSWTVPPQPWPDPFLITVPLTIPFQYSPEAGIDLLIEAEIVAPQFPPGSLLQAASTERPGVVHLHAPSLTDVTGTRTGLPIIMRVAYTDIAGTARTARFGAGCLPRAQSVYEQFTGGVNDLSGKTVTMTLNAAGGYDVSTTTGATVVPPTTTGLALGLFGVATQTLPFQFDYPGGSTTSISIDSNGSITLAGERTFNTIGFGLMNMLCVRLSPASQGMLADGATNVNNVYFETDPANPSVQLITWWNVQGWSGLGGTGQFSKFQVALIDNGSSDAVEFRYETLFTTSPSSLGRAVVGFTSGRGYLDPGSVDLTAGPTSTESEKFALSLAMTRPIAGTVANATIGHVPSLGISLLFLSAAQTAAPIDLAVLGMPRCGLYVQLPEFESRLSLGATPTAQILLAVPTDPSLLGAVAFAQAFAIDPTANPFGAISSNAVQITIGSF